MESMQSTISCYLSHNANKTKKKCWGKRKIINMDKHGQSKFKKTNYLKKQNDKKKSIK